MLGLGHHLTPTGGLGLGMGSGRGPRRLDGRQQPSSSKAALRASKPPEHPTPNPKPLPRLDLQPPSPNPKPPQKLYYNLIITSVSSLFALAIAFIELLSIVPIYLPVQGPFWNLLDQASNDFDVIGFGLAATFVAGWAFAAGVYYAGGFHRLEEPTPVPPVSKGGIEERGVTAVEESA